VTRGKALDLNEIREIQASFGRAAADAKRIGFDGVEIHGAHGYLIDAFLWEATNQRTDAYGGSFENRLRFAIEVIEHVRAAVGDDYPVSFRTSQWKSQDYAAQIYRSPQDLETAMTAFKAAGIDMIHCSTRRFWEPEFEGSELGFAGWAKKVSGLPTIAVGSVTLNTDFTTVADDSKGLRGWAVASPEANLGAVVERIARGEFDMIAVGRALLANPDWLRKVEAGKLSEIAPFSKDHVKVLY
jgi:2,4-dienoyl-CoA reductase-like NADH-dependent reductase (Old Yellow Enzyme family)